MDSISCFLSGSFLERLSDPKLGSLGKYEGAIPLPLMVHGSYYFSKFSRNCWCGTRDFANGTDIFRKQHKEFPGSCHKRLNHKRQRRKRQSVNAKREKSQTPKVLTAILTLPNLT